MTEQDWLAERFDEHRAHLRSVAYRLLGSLHEADDALQESSLRLSRSDTSDVANLRGWPSCCTTCSPCRSMTSQPCSAGQRTRPSSWRAAPGDGSGQVVRRQTRTWPGNTTPSGRSSRQLVAAISMHSSRYWTRTYAHGRRHHESAGRRGGSGSRRGGRPRVMFARPEATVHPALVNGAAGVVVTVGGRPLSVMGFTVKDGVIVAIDGLDGLDGLADADRLGRLDLPSSWAEFVS
jgi:hypothetical protein